MVLLRISPSPNDVDLLLAPLLSIMTNGKSQTSEGNLTDNPAPLRILIDCSIIYALKIIPRDVPSGLIGSSRLIPS